MTHLPAGVARKSSYYQERIHERGYPFELTEERAHELLQSGQVMWGLDAGEEIFDLYGVPYQPVIVLIADDQTVAESWDGIRAEEDIRASIESLLALSS